LLRKNGYYYKLYISQVGSFEEKEIVFKENLNISTEDISSKETKLNEDVIEEGEVYEYN